jgi:ribosomal protein S12 methylthiotransferase accessory factor YcaO
MIESEISSGGLFQEFHYPLGRLAHFKLVQFHRQLSNGIDCYGLGCATDLKSAYLKAFYEFLERKAFFERGVSLGFESTNGIAIHKLQTLAARTALAELIERDAFLLHWYAKVPFRILPPSYWSHLADYCDQLNELGYKAVFAKTELGLRTTYVAFLISLSSSGFVVGTSSGKSMRADLEKAFTEACTNLFLVGTQDDDGSIERIKTNGVRSLRDHRAYWLHFAGLPAWALAVEPSNIQNAEFQLRPKYIEISKAPLPVVGVSAEGVLQLRVGPPQEKDHEILLARLNFFDLTPPSLGDLPVHPIP